MQIGVAVGKFNPPHLGHVHLLDVAAAHTERVYVLLADRPDQSIPAEQRRQWLRDAAPPNVDVLVTTDDLPAANEPWARRALEVLPERPSIAFTSEPWGPGWAAAMGIEHVAVDVARCRFPISATQIRADLRHNFRWLVPAARAALARRVVVAGAESTGKTTLARALAQHYRTAWVPEYGREYWEGRRYLNDQSWTSAEFRHIARTQQANVDAAARNADHGLIVVDTDALVTSVWHRRYVGGDDPEVVRLRRAHPPDLYLVCAPDFPWQQDGTRESADQRVAMYQATLDLVRASGASWAAVAGPHQERMEQAIAHIDNVAHFEQLV